MSEASGVATFPATSPGLVTNAFSDCVEVAGIGELLSGVFLPPKKPFTGAIKLFAFFLKPSKNPPEARSFVRLF